MQAYPWGAPSSTPGWSVKDSILLLRAYCMLSVRLYLRANQPFSPHLGLTHGGQADKFLLICFPFPHPM